MYNKAWYDNNKEKHCEYKTKWRKNKKYGTTDPEEIERIKVINSFKRIIGETNFVLFSLDHLTTYEISSLCKRASELKSKKESREKYAKCSMCEEFRIKNREKDKKYYYKNDARKKYQREKQREYYLKRKQNENS